MTHQDYINTFGVTVYIFFAIGLYKTIAGHYKKITEQYKYTDNEESIFTGKIKYGIDEPTHITFKVAKPIKSKNAKVLKEFVEFCEEHPELRFWQALSDWTGKIFLSHEGPGLSEDTYNWVGKNK